MELFPSIAAVHEIRGMMLYVTVQFETELVGKVLFKNDVILYRHFVKVQTCI